MERIFWVTCPKCGCRYVCDYKLRHSKQQLICPLCKHTFYDEESPEIDDR